METFYRFFKRFDRITGENFYALEAPKTRTAGNFETGENPLLQAAIAERNRFLEAMDDDFNTGGGIATLFDLVRLLNKFADDEKLEDPTKRDPAKLNTLRRGTLVLKEIGNALGLFRKPVEEKSAAADDGLTAKLMSLLIELRAEARKKKDFAAADRIRNGLSAIGVILEDRPGGTEWSVK